MVESRNAFTRKVALSGGPNPRNMRTQNGEGPEGVAPKNEGAPKGRSTKVGGHERWQGGGRQNFVFSPAANFGLFSVCVVEFRWFSTRAFQHAFLWFTLCDGQKAFKCRVLIFALQNRPKNTRGKQLNVGRERQKQNAKCWAVRRRIGLAVRRRSGPEQKKKRTKSENQRQRKKKKKKKKKNEQKTRKTNVDFNGKEETTTGTTDTKKRKQERRRKEKRKNHMKERFALQSRST